MMTLVFLVCLASRPDVCEERRIPIYETVSPMACLMGAQPTLAAWRETHPGWRVGRWRCEGGRTARLGRGS